MDVDPFGIMILTILMDNPNDVLVVVAETVAADVVLVYGKDSVAVVLKVFH